MPPGRIERERADRWRNGQIGGIDMGKWKEQMVERQMNGKSAGLLRARDWIEQRTER